MSSFLWFSFALQISGLSCHFCRSILSRLQPSWPGEASAGHVLKIFWKLVPCSASCPDVKHVSLSSSLLVPLHTLSCVLLCLLQLLATMLPQLLPLWAAAMLGNAPLPLHLLCDDWMHSLTVGFSADPVPTLTALGDGSLWGEGESSVTGNRLWLLPHTRVGAMARDEEWRGEEEVLPVLAEGRRESLWRRQLLVLSLPSLLLLGREADAENMAEVREVFRGVAL